MQRKLIVGRQRGITMIGFLLGLIVLGFFAYLGMRIVPMYIEYFSVVKSLKHVVAQPGIEKNDEYKIRDYLSREFDIGYVDSIQDKDVKIKRFQDHVTLTADYEVRKPFVKELFIVGHFNVTANSGAGAKDDQ
ncbi:MAG: DUF4845 domain-containing protein [Lysobacteraceae bacterium]